MQEVGPLLAGHCWALLPAPHAAVAALVAFRAAAGAAQRRWAAVQGKARSRG